MSTATIDAPCLQVTPANLQHISHFPGADGVDKVEAYSDGSGPIGILLVHQSAYTLCQWIPLLDQFTAKGYRVMAITYRLDPDSDVEAAVAALRAQGAVKIVLVGASLGGTAVLAAATKVSPPVQAVVALSAPASFDAIDALAAAKRLTVPVAYFVGADDPEWNDDARSLYAATPIADKALHVLPGDSRHGADLWPAVRGDVFAFIAGHVRSS
jgi:dienelactone hydrolase